MRSRTISAPPQGRNTSRTAILPRSRPCKTMRCCGSPARSGRPRNRAHRATYKSAVIPGRRLASSPESITTAGVWIPGLPPQVGNCRPKAHPGMTADKLQSHHFRIERLRNKPSLTGIETDELSRNRRRFHGTLFVVVADRCPASHSGLDLRVRRFALEFDATKKRPRSVAAFRADRARIERARIEARSAAPVCQQPFWLLQGTRQREL